jgi:hypothetical protein
MALTVSQQAVDELATRLSAAMANSDALSGSHAFCKVQVGTVPGSHSLNANGFKFTKENLIAPPLVAISDGEVEYLAKDFMNHTAAYALNKMLLARAVVPVAHPNDAMFLTNIEAASEKIRLIGLSPVAIVSPGSPANQALRPYHWGQPGRPPLPLGIQLSYGRPGVYEFADGFVNDTPVISSGTPDRATFVVPLEWMATLVLEPKPLGVVVANHTITGTNEVSINFVWDASLQGR